MATPDNRNQAGTEKPASSGANLEKSENVGEMTRSKAQEVLATGPNTPTLSFANDVPPPPNDPEAKKPPTREELIGKLHLKYQYDERADSMIELIGKGVFKFGKDIPSLKATLDSFTMEQLELASTLQEPTLLLVPETSFAAKVGALDARKIIEGQEDCDVTGIYRENDPGSNEITGWKALIVDGAKEMKSKKGDNVGLTLADRIRRRKAVRRKNPDSSDLERGMDRHIYAMLMLEALRKGKRIDGDAGRARKGKWLWTPLDDDPANSASRAPGAYWRPVDRRVSFDWGQPEDSRRSARFRSSVGGDVIL